MGRAFGKNVVAFLAAIEQPCARVRIIERVGHIPEKERKDHLSFLREISAKKPEHLRDAEEREWLERAFGSADLPGNLEVRVYDYADGLPE